MVTEAQITSFCIEHKQIEKRFNESEKILKLLLSSYGLNDKSIQRFFEDLQEEPFITVTIIKHKLKNLYELQ